MSKNKKSEDFNLLELERLKLASATCFCQSLESLFSADKVDFSVRTKNHTLKVSIYLS